MPESPKDIDLSQGSLPNNVNTNISAPSDSLALTERKTEFKTNQWFKIIVFAIAMIMAISFLISGLIQAYKTTNHLISIQNETVRLVGGELKKEVCEEENKKVCEYKLVQVDDDSDQQEQNEIKPESQEKRDGKLDAPDKSKDESQSIVSQVVEQVWVLTGSIITLVIVVLTVGLTLLLTITKHAFTTSQKQETDSGTFDSLTTPIGSIIEGILEAIKKKFSK